MYVQFVSCKHFDNGKIKIALFRYWNDIRDHIDKKDADALLELNNQGRLRIRTPEGQEQAVVFNIDALDLALSQMKMHVRVLNMGLIQQGG